MSNAQWFYSDAQQQQLGPVTFEQIQQLAASGQIQPTTLIWTEGMPNWTAASQVNGVYNPVATPAAAAPVAGAQANPYATPGSAQPMGAPVGGSYPIPSVKKVSYPLFLITFLAGIILCFAAIGIFIASAASKIEASQDPPIQIETTDDREAFNIQQEARTQEQADLLMEEFPVAAIGVGVAGLLLIFVAGILGMICLYRAWCCVQPGGARSTPGKAVGFLFIPFFNIYWIFVAFYGWAQDWTRIRASHSNLAAMPRVSPPLFLTALIAGLCVIIPVVNLLALVAYPILYLIMMAQMHRVVNSMAAASRQTS
jgi:hypothetical protein